MFETYINQQVYDIRIYKVNNERKKNTFKEQRVTARSQAFQAMRNSLWPTNRPISLTQKTVSVFKPNYDNNIAFYKIKNNIISPPTVIRRTPQSRTDAAMLKLRRVLRNTKRRLCCAC